MIPLFKVVMPANAQMVFSLLLQIGAFEMIPTDVIFEQMLKALETDE